MVRFLSLTKNYGQAGESATSSIYAFVSKRKIILISTENNEFLLEAEGYEPISFPSLIEVEKGLIYFSTQGSFKVLVCDQEFSKELKRGIRRSKLPFAQVSPRIFSVIRQLL